MTPLFLIAALALAAPAAAQEPVCVRAEIVPGFESFGQAGGTALAIGAPAMLTLRDATGETFTPPLNRPAQPGSFGGTFPLTIRTAGTYRIALSPGAWIDVIGGSQRLASVTHGHGPACSGIAKIVDFALQPGTYAVQLSSVKAPTIKVMIAQK